MEAAEVGWQRLAGEDLEQQDDRLGGQPGAGATGTLGPWFNTGTRPGPR